jgi:hypothetical protein
MNVQIYSNTPNQEGDVNYNNKFTMTLPEPIDGENKTCYIRALNVTYPIMINNVEDKTFGIRFKHRLFWNKQLLAKDNVEIESEWLYLICGRYTLKKIIQKLNALTREYGFYFSINMEPKYVYRYQQVSPVLFEQYTVKSAMDFSFEMTKDLKYVLGMDEFVFHPEVGTVGWVGMGYLPADYVFGYTPMEYILTTVITANVNGDTVNNLWYLMYGKYSADITNGKTRMFIYCDEVVPSFVGDVRAPLLAQVSLQTKYDKSVGLYTHDLPDISRELINTQKKNLHIRICDLQNNLIQFNGGSVGIECIIE